ncbi:MFS transporter [Rothia halotolerans]|uniref:MFS transporter n=1 Tax=Rothia halotolerans TaxID=405770 RepID=UPI001EE030F9|nr:MFS transporter [Rothia halotolerans]
MMNPQNDDARAAEPEREARHETVVSAVGRTYFPVALIARLPYAMMVIGVLTLVVSVRGSLTLGGATSAMVGIGTAVSGPLIGTAADRFGQRAVLLVAVVLSVASLLTLTAVVYADTPPAVVLAAALLIGATTPQIPPMSRSRLVGVINRRLRPERRPRALNGTMAYESAADEITFVFGPMIVGVLATLLSPSAPILAAVLLSAAFVVAFALHRSVRETQRSSEAGEPQASFASLLTPRLLVVIAGVLGIGVLFGSTLTSLTSLMEDAGHGERAGLVYAAMGVGSAAFALAAAWFSTSFTLRARWLVFSALIVLGAVGLYLSPSIPLVLVSLLVIGIGVGPTLVTEYSLVSQRSPASRSATAMSLASTSIVIGQSAASATTGYLADAFGTRGAALVPIAAALVVLAAAVANLRVRDGR